MDALKLIVICVKSRNVGLYDLVNSSSSTANKQGQVPSAPCGHESLSQVPQAYFLFQEEL
jgi:hypothetical protein